MLSDYTSWQNTIRHDQSKNWWNPTSPKRWPGAFSFSTSPCWSHLTCRILFIFLQNLGAFTFSIFDHLDCFFIFLQNLGRSSLLLPERVPTSMDSSWRYLKRCWWGRYDYDMMIICWWFSADNMLVIWWQRFDENKRGIGTSCWDMNVGNQCDDKYDDGRKTIWWWSPLPLPGCSMGPKQMWW